LKEAKELAVIPVINECLNRCKATENTVEISMFRQKAIDMVSEDPSYLSFVKKRLHEPTIRLRRGECFDEVQFFKDLSADLTNKQQLDTETK
jgi:hypothetical protein